MNDDDDRPPTEAERAFTERLVAALGATAAAEREASLVEALRASPATPAPRRRGRHWPLVASVIAAAAVAVLVTWVVVAPRGGEVAALDGGGGALPGAVPGIRLDARGRLAEATLDDQRLVFRSGRLVRMEHLRDGALDGTAVDFDVSGRVVRVETWTRGTLTRRRDAPLDLD